MSQNEKFVVENPGPDAVKLANALYNTYVKIEEPMMVLSVERLCRLFGKENDEEGIAYVERVFEELNEPTVVQNYEFEGRMYEWQVVQFCIYSRIRDADGEHYMVMLNPIYIDAMQKLMEEPFVNFDAMKR